MSDTSSSPPPPANPNETPPAQPSQPDSSMTKAVAPQVGGGWPMRSVIAFGGMIAGALVGMVVQAAVSTTGVLGPGVEDLLTEQSANFQKLEAKLEALRSTTDPAQIKSVAADLGTLLVQQEKLAQRTHEELRGARGEIDRLKEQAIESAGAAGGANLWLKPGESMTVGQAGTVLGFVNFSGQTAGTRTTRAVVNIGGESKTLGVGDAVQIKAGGETYKIIYKQITPRADGRVGFDVVKE